MCSTRNIPGDPRSPAVHQRDAPGYRSVATGASRARSGAKPRFTSRPRWICPERFNPATLIDLATLTGRTALGPDIAQLYSPSDEIAPVLIDVGTDEGELLGRMPLDPRYESKVDCEHADMKNSGTEAGGSIAAALMLQRFVTGCRWAHIDMAANAWKSSSNDPTIPDGATGFAVRLLNRVVDGNRLRPS